MAFSNRTINYQLPQYIGSDKPTYLADFNYAMNKIDESIKANENAIVQNSNKIGDLSELETQNKTNIVDSINEVNEHLENYLLKNKIKVFEKTITIESTTQMIQETIALTDGFTYENSIILSTTILNNTQKLQSNQHLTTIYSGGDIAFIGDRIYAVAYENGNLSIRGRLESATIGDSITLKCAMLKID